jgi:hypothetical protein
MESFSPWDFRAPQGWENLYAYVISIKRCSLDRAPPSSQAARDGEQYLEAGGFGQERVPFPHCGVIAVLAELPAAGCACQHRCRYARRRLYALSSLFDWVSWTRTKPYDQRRCRSLRWGEKRSEPNRQGIESLQSQIRAPVPGIVSLLRSRAPKSRLAPRDVVAH